MQGLNQATLLGNIGRDPETMITNAGMSIMHFSLATTSNRKVDGQYQDVTEWHRITVFGKTAEALSWLAKGMSVLVVGEIRTSKYTDKDGNERKSTEIVAYRVIVVTEKGEGGGKHSEAAASDWLEKKATIAAPPPFASNSNADDDRIPF